MKKKSKDEPNEYWHCIIGPFKRSEIPNGGDAPPRMAVKDAIYRMTGKNAEHCWSGWGIDEQTKDKVLKIT